ncbi:MAG: hypothetical protein MZV49_02645 [Rhodopseudomonas palustris]|nr:hypothetical protein [Rhodopseudomonas palustris]
MKRFKLTEMQAEAILNMRLRALAQARGDGDPAASTRSSPTEQKDLKALLGSRGRAVGEDRRARSREVREHVRPKTPLGKRRTELRRRARDDRRAI